MKPNELWIIFWFFHLVCRKSKEACAKRKPETSQSTNQFDFHIRKLWINNKIASYMRVVSWTIEEDWDIRSGCHNFRKWWPLRQSGSYQNRKLSRNFVCSPETSSCRQGIRSTGNWYGPYKLQRYVLWVDSVICFSSETLFIICFDWSFCGHICTNAKWKIFSLSFSLIDISSDLEGLKKYSEEGARFGYTGKQIIHPTQIDIVHEAFLPSKAKIEWATRLLEEFAIFQSEGKVSWFIVSFM